MASHTPDLPIHFRTGLRALGIVAGRPVWPIRGGSEPPEPTPPPEPEPAAEPEFPPNTPLEQMKPEQREAYWKHKARLHEGRVKALGSLTPEQLAEIREKADKHDALEAELASDKDRAIAETKQATQAELDAKYRPMLAETAFRVAIGDRKPQTEVDEFIADLNLPRFLTDDGKVDTAKVLSRVEQFAPATGTQPLRPGPSPAGQGGTGPASAGQDKSLAAGRDLYRNKYHADKANSST